jgi:alginate O-acetyltransferase complex protein AlgI
MFRAGGGLDERNIEAPAPEHVSMLFNSFTFVVFFFAVTLVHSLPLTSVVRKSNLLLASYLFYASWEPWFVTLLMYSTAVNWVAGTLLSAWRDRPRWRRHVLWSAVVLNIGVLAAFKYGNQLLALSQLVSTRLAAPFSDGAMTILLPVGLSFFTLQSLSYTIDVYRGTIEPPSSFLDFALFVCFFPVLLAGPLLRAGRFLPQCIHLRRATGSEFAWGLSLFTSGLFLKITLADHVLAPIVARVFEPSIRPDTLSAWTGTLAFAGQDYCDFAGYSTCAMGVALCLGLSIPANFRTPFASIGFRDLWQRWHITLVAWLRDYVFNSLGGVYKGYVRAAVNVMVVMLLIGLWHGAAWTYLIFGALHGTFLIGEMLLQRTWLRRFRAWESPAGKCALWLLTITLAVIAFVFYRVASVEHALSILSAMAGYLPTDAAFRLPDDEIVIAIVVIEAIMISHWLCRDRRVELAVPWWAISLGLAAMLLAITISSSDSQGFLYFQY